MESVNVTEFRKHLPSYLKRVAAGKAIRVTSRGRAIARLVPEEDPAEAARKRLADLRGTMIVGNIDAPFENVDWTGDADNL
ncbi:MAG TPA: type II toxin-antitoxin system prevent-host-death family antitoxin [Gammaproteobacteria bacterium]|nr:type II toxin-antitoxin system prevent-host-death family antitoxin [Gammaproteobacteria bacterium]